MDCIETRLYPRRLVVDWATGKLVGDTGTAPFKAPTDLLILGVVGFTKLAVAGTDTKEAIAQDLDLRHRFGVSDTHDLDDGYVPAELQGGLVVPWQPLLQPVPIAFGEQFSVLWRIRSGISGQTASVLVACYAVPFRSGELARYMSEPDFRKEFHARLLLPGTVRQAG